MRSGLVSDFLNFKSQKNHVNGMIENAKVCYYSGLINDAGGDQRQLFKIVKGLISKSATIQYPVSESVVSLANAFNKFFITKVENIRAQFVTGAPSLSEEQKKCVNSFSDFYTVSESDMKALIKKAPAKSCDLDPIPTDLLKQSLPEAIGFYHMCCQQDFEKWLLSRHF